MLADKIMTDLGFETMYEIPGMLSRSKDGKILNMSFEPHEKGTEVRLEIKYDC